MLEYSVRVGVLVMDQTDQTHDWIIGWSLDLPNHGLDGIADCQGQAFEPVIGRYRIQTAIGPGQFPIGQKYLDIGLGAIRGLDNPRVVDPGVTRPPRRLSNQWY